MIEKAKAWLAKWGLQDRVIEFSVSSATVRLAAEALGVGDERIAKTLSFDVNGECVLVVVAGDIKADNKKFKDTFHTKAKMLPPGEVELKTGHAVGGVCPFGINDGVKVYLDESLKRFDTVYPACGSSNSAVKLSVSELETASMADGWVDIGKAASETGR